MKANHRVNVVRVGEILPHPNADKLELTHVEGYQLVIGKGNYKAGDLAVYIQPDSVVPQTDPFKFIWQDHVGIDGTVPEKRRRITVKRLRKEYSEGLLMPVTELGFQVGQHGEMQGLCFNGKALEVGQDVAELIGVTHYVPEFDRESTVADSLSFKNSPKRRYPRTLRGWMYLLLHKVGLGWGLCGRGLALDLSINLPVYDVDSLKNHKSHIQPGDTVHVTEKIHGSNARYTVIDDVFYAGSRTQWKQKGSNVWWNAAKQHPEIEQWCREHPGLMLVGEVGPTQKGFRYGTDKDETFFFAFKVYNPSTQTYSWPANYGFATNVPVVFSGFFTDEVLTLADGKSLVPGAGHLREGVVVTNLFNGETLKIVSNAFLEKDGQ